MFSLFDRQKALGMVYNQTNTCKGAKLLDAQTMTMHRPQNHLKETGSSKDRQRSS